MSGTKWLLNTNVVIGLLKQQAATISLIESHQFDLSRAVLLTLDERLVKLNEQFNNSRSL